MLRGGEGVDRVVEAADVARTLSDTQLLGLGTDELTGIEEAELTGGDDRMFGGAGNDTLLAGQGNDTLRGQLDDVVVLGEAGIDNVRGNKGNDTIAGGGNGIAANPSDTVVGETIDDDFSFAAPWVNV